MASQTPGLSIKAQLWYIAGIKRPPFHPHWPLPMPSSMCLVNRYEAGRGNISVLQHFKEVRHVFSARYWCFPKILEKSSYQPLPSVLQKQKWPLWSLVNQSNENYTGDSALVNYFKHVRNKLYTSDDLMYHYTLSIHHVHCIFPYTKYIAWGIHLGNLLEIHNPYKNWTNAVPDCDRWEMLTYQ